MTKEEIDKCNYDQKIIINDLEEKGFSVRIDHKYRCGDLNIYININKSEHLFTMDTNGYIQILPDMFEFLIDYKKADSDEVIISRKTYRDLIELISIIIGTKNSLKSRDLNKLLRDLNET